MPNLEKQLQLAARIVDLRRQLAEAEAEFAGTQAPKRSGPTPKGPGRRSTGTSISQRVLTMVREAGRGGIQRKDILSVIPKTDAVHSALQTHRAAGRIKSDNGVWVSLEVPGTRSPRSTEAKTYLEGAQ